MNKKYVFGIAATSILGVATLIPLSVSALTSNSSSTFAQKLSAKLGIEQTKVETALKDVQTDLRTEKQAEMKAEIAKLVTSGKLTQRQADLLNAAGEIRATIADDAKPNPEEMKNLTKEQREAKREEHKTAMQKKIVDELNKKGWNTSTTELDAAHKVLIDAGVKPMMGGKGPGKGMGRMMR